MDDHEKATEVRDHKYIDITHECDAHTRGPTAKPTAPHLRNEASLSRLTAPLESDVTMCSSETKKTGE